MDPKDNQQPDSPKTPTKPKSSHSQYEGLKFIDFEQRSQQPDLVDQLMSDGVDKSIPFYSDKKFNPSNESQNYSSQDEYSDQQNISQNEDSAGGENQLTVKKNTSTKSTSDENSIEETPKNNQKGCNCGKTKCLKGYCPCYKKGKTCSDQCQCTECQNVRITSSHIKNLKAALQFESYSNEKGCNCKNSGCQKKYCICLQNGRKCTDFCKCIDCKNSNDNDHDHDDLRDEKGVRLVFTARKKKKICEFGHSPDVQEFEDESQQDPTKN